MEITSGNTNKIAAHGTQKNARGRNSERLAAGSVCKNAGSKHRIRNASKLGLMEWCKQLVKFAQNLVIHSVIIKGAYFPTLNFDE